jgi:hypothetical protein
MCVRECVRTHVSERERESARPRERARASARARARARARIFAPQLPLTLAPDRPTFLQTTHCERERETVNEGLRPGPCPGAGPRPGPVSRHRLMKPQQGVQHARRRSTGRCSEGPRPGPCPGHVSERERERARAKRERERVRERGRGREREPCEITVQCCRSV